MLHTIFQQLDRWGSIKAASAHCDIPCKIYDPMTAQISVLTMIRMDDLIQELAGKDTLTIAEQAQLGRLVTEKDSHGIKVKEEVRVIWGDYFKQPQIDAFPQIHNLVHAIMLQASKVKQGIDRADAVTLLEQVNEFADIFWQTKNVATVSAICPYPPNETVVYPKLTEA